MTTPIFAGQTAVVTGSSSGIGRAIAMGLAEAGADLVLVARNADRLEAVASTARTLGSTILVRPADLSDEASLRALAATLERDLRRLDILVHAAGVIALGTSADGDVADLDRQYATNLRAPYALTQALLPMLRRHRGQMVFLNSSAGLRAGANVGQYAATKHALKAVADSLREEVNADGMRVLSVFLGRTATPMQAALHASEGKPYRPEQLIQPGDVAAIVLSALSLSRTAEVTDISIRPMMKPSSS